MAFANAHKKEVNCKILYCGPAQSGKTTNLRAVFNQTYPDASSGLFELEATPNQKSHFDFLPVSIGQVRDYHVRLHLYTIPTQPLFETLKSVIARGIDGYVFVADSRLERMGFNVEALQSLKKFLEEEGYVASDLPHVFQYNKRDLPDAVPVEALRTQLNPNGAEDFQASASQSQGTLETLQGLATQVIAKLSHAPQP